jgi:hypothetical protein
VAGGGWRVAVVQGQVIGLGGGLIPGGGRAHTEQLVSTLDMTKTAEHKCRRSRWHQGFGECRTGLPLHDVNIDIAGGLKLLAKLVRTVEAGCRTCPTRPTSTTSAGGGGKNDLAALPTEPTPAPATRLIPSASPRPPSLSRLSRPASPPPASQKPAVPSRCTEPRRRGQVRYTGVHVSGESLVPLGSGGMPLGIRRFLPSFYRISRPADTVAPGPGAFGCGQSPRSRLTRFRTPGELPSKSVPFEDHVGNLAGRSAADV